MAKMKVDRGEHRAYTRRYCTASPASSPSAPIRVRRAGAARKRTAPMRAPVPKISRQAQVKILLAARSSPWPRRTEMGTEEPTPIRSARAKLIITKGIARLMAAKAASPRTWPTSTPSIS